jgi:hypothetical protein
VRAIDLQPGEAALHDGDGARCAVVLPGVRYFSQAPLLWFAREAVQARGWSVLELSERAPAGEDPFEWMRGRAARALDVVDAPTQLVVGKSLASAAAPLVARRALPAIWLTPLLDRSEVAEALAASQAPTLLIGSTADSTWAGGPGQLGAAVEVLEFEGLNHSLQVRKDPLASLDVLRQVIERISPFLDRLG